MKALVLGGSGFIGSHLVDRLLAEQHQVAVLDVKPAALPVECFVGQLEDSDLLKKALQGRDLVFHTVSTTVPATSNKNMEFDIASNLISFVRLLELMRENQVERIVYLSSGGAVYGNPIDYPIREEHPLNPISSYGIVKVAAEKYLFLFQELYGLKPIIIRPSNAYGPRQSIVKPQGIIGHFLSRAVQGLPLEIWGDGSIRRDYIFVRDLIDLIMAAVHKDVKGIFNAGAGSDSSVLETVAVMEQVLQKKLVVTTRPAMKHDVQRVRLDISKAQRTLAWSPQVQLRDGIAEQYRYIAEVAAEQASSRDNGSNAS